jgi:hypothetical protein
LVHTSQLVQTAPQEHGAVQHPVADAVQTGLVSPGSTLLDLLKQDKIKPVIAQRLPLEEARRTHEMLGEGGVLGKLVLLPIRLAENGYEERSPGDDAVAPTAQAAHLSFGISSSACIASRFLAPMSRV